MHFFLYEWITGGGLVEESGALPKSLLNEGSAMLTAMAKDLAAIPGASVSALKDMRLDALSLPGCQVYEVQSRSDHEEQFLRQAERADYTLVIAPEFDGILNETHRLIVENSNQLLGCISEFVALTTDKHQTALRLAKQGVPVPEAIVFEPDEEKLPTDFNYPAVLKPVDGVGSQDMLLVSKPSDEPPPYAWSRRLERYCPGISASVSFLCGPSRRVALPACRQRISEDGRFQYLGGSRLMQPELARRATALAERCLEALPPARGYVGVDLIVGKAADGSEDVVLEVNPRLTTSYVGLRAMTNDNLARALVDVFIDEETSIEFNQDAIEFFPDGTVTRLEPR